MNAVAFKVTPRDQQIVEILATGADNGYIAKELSISARTVKQHLRMLYLRAGISGDHSKRLRLIRACAVTELGSGEKVKLAPRALQMVRLIAEGLKYKAIGQQMGLSEDTIKQMAHTVFDKTGMSSKLELALWFDAHRWQYEAVQ